MTVMSTSPEAVVSDVYHIVDSRIDYLNDFANKYGSMLSGAVYDIQNIKLNKPAPPQALSAPVFVEPVLSDAIAPTSEFSPIRDVAFPNDPDLSLLNSIDSLDDIVVPDPPAIMPIALPSEPALVDVPLPVKPAMDVEIQMPDEPVIALPDVPNLEEITIPTFVWEDIDDFEATGAPTLGGVSLPSDRGIEWDSSKEKYSSEIANRLEQYFMGYLNSNNDFGEGVTVGTTGLPAAIENALFYRAKERQSEETQRAIDEAMNVWASRGFTMPQGALNKTIEGIKAEGLKLGADLNRDVFSEAAKIRIEQLRFVVQQGIALEEQKRRMVSDMLGRLFEVAKWQADAEMRVFNAQVSLFNIRQDAYRMQFEIYKTKIDAKIAKLQAYKTSIDGLSAISQLNQQTLEVYKTQVQAVLSHVDIYKTKLQAVSVQSDIIKSKFEVFRTEVQAYAEQMGTNKNLVDLYDARVKAEMSKGALSETQARNYASLIQGLSSKADLKLKDSQLRIETVKAGLEGFKAKVDLSQAQMQAHITQAQQETSRFQAAVEAWKASKGVETSQIEMKSRYADMVSRTNIAYSQMQIAKYQADMEAAKQEAMIALEASKAVGQYTAQLASGAMSAAHISASLSGSGSLSRSESNSTSESTSHSYSY